MNARNTFAICSQRVLIEGDVGPATLWIKDGKIEKITKGIAKKSDSAILDMGTKVIMSGVVDTHAHINEPGRTEWEGFQTATRSAAAGGITSVIDMPLNSIPATTSVTALRAKQSSAFSHCTIDYGFWGGVIPGNLKEIEPMIAEGVMGFKCFLCPSGVDEFPHVFEKDLRAAMPILAKNKVPLIVHAEVESDLSANPKRDPSQYKTYLDSRPSSWEVDAIRMMIRLCRETKCQTHIVHLSSAEALADIRAARAEGLPFTAETCPHYLIFEAEKIPTGATAFKCAPPIRDHANREALWEAIREGVIEFIVSDHSPCTPHLKKLELGDFHQAWGGISGLQFSLAAVWTEMKQRGFSLADLGRLMSANTARFIGLDRKKGAIAPGNDADLVVWDPDSEFVLTADQIYHRHKVTPYLGTTLKGKIHGTLLRGEWIYRDGKFPTENFGKALRRNEGAH